MKTFATWQAIDRAQRRPKEPAPRASTPKPATEAVAQLGAVQSDGVGRKPSADPTWDEERFGFVTCRRPRP